MADDRDGSMNVNALKTNIQNLTRRYLQMLSIKPVTPLYRFEYFVIDFATRAFRYLLSRSETIL